MVNIDFNINTADEIFILIYLREYINELSILRYTRQKEDDMYISVKAWKSSIAEMIRWELCS